MSYPATSTSTCVMCATSSTHRFVGSALSAVICDQAWQSSALGRWGVPWLILTHVRPSCCVAAAAAPTRLHPLSFSHLFCCEEHQVHCCNWSLYSTLTAYHSACRWPRRSFGIRGEGCETKSVPRELTDIHLTHGTYEVHHVHTSTQRSVHLLRWQYQRFLDIAQTRKNQGCDLGTDMDVVPNLPKCPVLV